jgi:hypothetical protein
VEENPKGCCWVAVDVIKDEDVEKAVAAIDAEGLPNGVKCSCSVLLDAVADVPVLVWSGVFRNDDAVEDAANGVCGCVPNGMLLVFPP